MLGLAVFLSSPAFEAFAQPVYPAGGYVSLDELRNRQPSVNADFIANLRSEPEKEKDSGNDYYITAPQNGIDAVTIANDLYAVVIKDTVYLNTRALKLPYGYSKALTSGKYLAFKTMFREIKKRRLMDKDTPGIGIYLGDLTGPESVFAKRKPAGTYLLVLDTETAGLYLLDRNYILHLLKNFPDLEYLFSLEPEQSKEETLISYLQKVNSATGK